MDIDKEIIGKPPNEAVVINEQIIKKAESYKQEDEQDSLIISDSREKLEDDALELASKIWHKGCYFGEGNGNLISCAGMLKSCAWDENDVIALLDRQAAITEQEWLDGKTHIFGMTFDEVQGLQAKVEELTAERDELKRRLEMELGTMSGMELTIDSLTAERNRLQERNDRQGETIDKLKAERDELSNAVDKLRRRMNGMFCLNDLFDKDNTKLETEVESLQRQVKALRDLNDLYEQRITKLTDERERLRDVVVQQAENFKKLEIELSQKTCTAEDLRTTAYECEQLKKKLDKIKEIVDAI